MSKIRISCQTIQRYPMENKEGRIVYRFHYRKDENLASKLLGDSSGKNRIKLYLDFIMFKIKVFSQISLRYPGKKKVLNGIE